MKNDFEGFGVCYVWDRCCYGGTGGKFMVFISKIVNLVLVVLEII